MITRRTILAMGVAGGLASLSSGLYAGEMPRKKILLRSSWQTVNIGDIAHTPGVLALLEKHLPDVEIWLWPSSVDNGVEELLIKRFPKLKIAKSVEQKQQAKKECDFYLHGSGASWVAYKDNLNWIKETGKPFGIWGITANEFSPELVENMNKASFVFFRDGVSLKMAKEAGVTKTVTGFGPDGAFNTDLTNDEAAIKFLKENRLEEGKFVCCISRLRYTPYWKIKNQSYNETKDKRNIEMAEKDHSPLRSAVESIIKNTDHKVLLCPEDKSQMEVARIHIYDKLPESIKSRVVWKKDYWLTDEALSTYKKSAGLFGLEMHSPIMCIGNEIPAIVCRFKEQTTKGFMWENIGLKDWLFDFDQEDQIIQAPKTILQMVQQKEKSKEKARDARKFVLDTQIKNLEVLKKCIS